jgi:hypothetical protein
MWGFLSSDFLHAKDITSSGFDLGNRWAVAPSTRSSSVYYYGDDLIYTARTRSSFTQKSRAELAKAVTTGSTARGTDMSC